MTRQRAAFAGLYGTEVPDRLLSVLGRAHVTAAEFDLLLSVVGHHWPAIEAHVRAHTDSARRYQACTVLPGRLCDRWCPVGGDPVLIAAAERDAGEREGDGRE